MTVTEKNSDIVLPNSQKQNDKITEINYFQREIKLLIRVQIKTGRGEIRVEMYFSTSLQNHFIIL